MRPDRLLAMLCLTTGLQTFSIGAFPALLPELGRSAALADWQLGAVAGAFGLARMLADLPAGLLMTHHVRRALIAGPAVVLAGMACLVLGGVTLVGALPGALAWQTAFLVACSPILVALVALKALLVLLPDDGGDRPWFARSAAAAEASPRAADRGASALAFAAGGAVALAYATLEQFVIPVRGSREFGLERSGIAHLLMLAQLCDTVALLPVGALADRLGTARVLGVVLLTFAAAMAMIGLGPLPLVVAGCVVFGLSMAGWMLPVGLLRAATPASQVAWRTARFRVFVNGGMFLGPFASGLLGAAHARVLPATLSAVLLTVGVVLLARRARR